MPRNVEKSIRLAEAKALGKMPKAAGAVPTNAEHAARLRYMKRTFEYRIATTLSLNIAKKPHPDDVTGLAALEAAIKVLEETPDKEPS